VAFCVSKFVKTEYFIVKTTQKNDTIWDEIKKCRIDEGTQVRIIKRTPALK